LNRWPDFSPSDPTDEYVISQPSASAAFFAFYNTQFLSAVAEEVLILSVSLRLSLSLSLYVVCVVCAEYDMYVAPVTRICCRKSMSGIFRPLMIAICCNHGHNHSHNFSQSQSQPQPQQHS
jgi:hypothetical protein